MCKDDQKLTFLFLWLKLYALTTLAPARDFWLMRYTSLLEDGSVVVSSLQLLENQQYLEIIHL